MQSPLTASAAAASSPGLSFRAPSRANESTILFLIETVAETSTTLADTTARVASLEAQNAALRAAVAELTARLDAIAPLPTDAGASPAARRAGRTVARASFTPVRNL